MNETVAIHLFLKNIGSETITMFFPYLHNRVGFIIKDTSNTVVFNFPLGGIATIDEFTLEPEDQISETLNWSQIGHYPDGSGGILQNSVPPGTYYIIGRTGKYLIGSLEEPEPWTPWIETPPITITIG